MWWHLPGSCLKCGSKTDATIHTFFVVDVSAMPKRCLIAVVKSHLKAATDCMSSSLDSRWLFMRLHSMGYSINADGVVSLHMSEVATCSGWSTGSRCSLIASVRLSARAFLHQTAWRHSCRWERHIQANTARQGAQTYRTQNSILSCNAGSAFLALCLAP